MSWDVLLLRLPNAVSNISDLSDDFAGDSLASNPSTVANILRDVLPAIDVTDPSWAVLETDDYSIEFNIGDESPCTSVMLHVRGPESVIEPIRMVCERTGWQAFDTSTGDLMNFGDDPAKGLRSWIAYREKSGITGPLKGISIPINTSSSVAFDGRRAEPPSTKRKWWQIWC